MEIRKSGTQLSTQGSAENFSGAVSINPIFQAPEPGRVSTAVVTFEPGARTAWHSHPLGQTLIVTSGSGRVQSWGSAIEEIQTGDVVWCPPEEKHWHGASPTQGMTHISIVERLNGKSADWMEQVSDRQNK